MTNLSRRVALAGGVLAIAGSAAFPPSSALAQNDPCPEDPRCAVVGPPPADCGQIFRPTWVPKHVAWCYVPDVISWGA